MDEHRIPHQGENRSKRSDGSGIIGQRAPEPPAAATEPNECSVLGCTRRERSGKPSAILEAERANGIRPDRLRALGEMSAGIAHELNQPLVGVRGLAEHLLLAMKRGWTISPERMQKKLQGIIDQADRMSHIIQHVGSFYRQSGTAPPEYIDLNDVVSAALELMGIQLRHIGIDVDRCLHTPMPLIIANPFSLEEVVLNCLTNARDAIEERTAASDNGDTPRRIMLQTRVIRSGISRRIILGITDTGIGIPPEVLVKAHCPFFTTKGPERGTGLGLHLSKSIVESYGGTLALQSQSMSGTTVTVSFPLGVTEE